MQNVSPTPLPRPGLTQISAALDIERTHLDLLVSLFAPEDDPPPTRGQQPLPAWRRLCAAVGYLLLPRATFRRVGGIVGIGKSSAQRAFLEYLPRLSSFGLVQADGSILQDEGLAEWLAEMAESGEVALVDGTYTQVMRPSRASTRRLFYQVKSGTYCYQSLTLSTAQGDILSLDGGWPGRIHELDILDHSAFLPALESSGVRVLADRGFRGVEKRTTGRWALPVGSWSRRSELSEEVREYNGRQNSARAPAEHANAALKHWGMMRFSRLPIVRFREAERAVATIIMLLRYGERLRL